MNHILIKLYDNGQLKVRYQAEYHMHPQNVFYPKNDYADNYGPWRNPNCPDPNQSINQSLIPNGKRCDREFGLQLRSCGVHIVNRNRTP